MKRNIGKKRVLRFNSKRESEEESMKSLYAIDVGIGFTKRAYRQDVDSEVMIRVKLPH